MSFQSNAGGPSPDPRMVGAMLAQRAAAAHAAGLDDDYGTQGAAGAIPGAPDESGPFGDALAHAQGLAGRASDLLGRGAGSLGPLTATGGDHTGTPGRTMPPPPVSRMPSQSASNPVTRPELETADGQYTPGVSHSSSATATALGDAMSRTTGGSTGIGKVQNPSAGSPLQRLQLTKMGLSPVEIDLLAHGGGVKGI